MVLVPLPRMTTKTVGAMRVDALVDSVGPTRLPEELLRDAPDDVVERAGDWVRPYLSDDGRMILAYQSFLIRLDGRVILVDCAVGEDGNFPARPDWHLGKSNWLNHLGLAGMRPQDIDTVFLTHLHMDHTGWLTRNVGGVWQPTFPDARHVTSAPELAFWTERHSDFPYMSTSIPDCVAPVQKAGLLGTVAPGDEIAPGLHVIDLAGHSPGMIGLEYRPNGVPLATFNADLMHHPIQMASPQCATIFCADPDKAVAVRRHKLADYAAHGTVMFCNHFPGECAGHVVPQGDGYRFQSVG